MLKFILDLHREHDLIKLTLTAIIACSLTYIVIMLLAAFSIL